MTAICVSQSAQTDPQPGLPDGSETQRSFTPFDHLRDEVLHAHTDLRVAVKMLRRLRWIAAWKKARQGYHRLGNALDTRRHAA